MSFILIEEKKDASCVLEKWMVAVLSKTDASERIRQISSFFTKKPVHLKRVRVSQSTGALKALLLSAEEFKAELSQTAEYLRILQIKQEDLSEVDVPVNDPQTEEGRAEAHAHWPCTFRPIVPDVIPEDISKRVIEIWKKGGIYQSTHQECAETAIILEDASKHLIFSSETWLTSDKPLEHTILNLVRMVSKVTTGYLCTDRVVILSNEPCFMCGMALVHARVKSVFICGKPSIDSPFTKHHINSHLQLNHRYRAYMLVS